MSYKLLGGGSDLNTIVSDVNQNILELKNRELTEIFRDDAGTRRVLLGKGDNGFYGLKVSPAGTDVYTAADNQLVFNSNQNVFKIVSTLTVSFTHTSGAVNPSSTTVTINHNLGYVPLTESTVTITTLTNGTPGIYPLPFLTPGTGGGTTNVFIMLSYLRVFSVTSTSITYQLGIQAPTQTFAGTITCYIKQESAV